MTPRAKENVTMIIFVVLGFIMASLIVFSLGGCAHPVVTAKQNPSICHAAEISDRIDNKAVIVAEWLKTHQ